MYSNATFIRYLLPNIKYWLYFAARTYHKNTEHMLGS